MEIYAYGLADRYEYCDAYFDDLETGDASCYMFDAREEAVHEDAWYERNREENMRNRISEDTV